MQVASCLGEQFSKDVLLTAVTELLSDWSSERTSSGSLIFTVDELSSIDSALGEFEREGLWESDDGMNYRFAHDQIQVRGTFMHKIRNFLLAQHLCVRTLKDGCSKAHSGRGAGKLERGNRKDSIK